MLFDVFALICPIQHLCNEKKRSYLLQIKCLPGPELAKCEQLQRDEVRQERQACQEDHVSPRQKTHG